MRPLEISPLVAPEAKERVQKKADHGFTDSLADAVKQVDQLQTDADGEASKLAQGGGNLHETALALEKADIAMRVAVKVRNKFVDAYNDIMRMPV
ncbi:MAG: flagellar hook-basal body complex protein FliE [Myxococcaceae bacterium]